MSAMEVDGKDDKGFDEQLYNRQTYAIGAEAQRKLGRTDVLVCGVSGLGMEIVKNITLTGVRSVTLHDTKPVEWSDLSSGFFFRAEHVGGSRVDACIAKLQELNKYSSIKKLDAESITEDVLTKWKAESTEQHPDSYQVVVFVDHCTSHLKAVNKFCRDNGIKFISAESRGLSGCIFVDDGPAHIVYDIDGEEVRPCLVTGITSDKPATVKVHEDQRHELSDGDTVIFADLADMPELHNDSLEGDVTTKKAFQVKVTGPFTFTLHTTNEAGELVPFDSTKLAPYVRGGYLTRVKLPVKQTFQSLEESLRAPEFLITDFAKMEAPGTLHLLFQALHEFHRVHGHFPAPHDPGHAAKVVELAKDVHKNFPDFQLDEEVISKLAAVSSGNLNPMAALLGGFAAHEVLKAASGKFTPIHQWFYFDARECLLDTPPSPESCKALGTRYDGIIAVFGKDFVDKLRKSRYFIVGAGALGCEFLKNFAMVGVGCDPEGSVVVTDMDAIEKSNLSRQFLFRATDVGKLKSQCAAEAAKHMNPDFNVKFLTEKVAPETESIFDDDFWDSLSGVCNALDNIQARLYVDSRCVYYRKSLLESGTLGSKGNVQVIQPYLTESYGSSRDPPEKTIPICTLKNFPNAIEHTIQWARDAFEGLFCQVPRDVNGYLTDKTYLAQLEKEPGTRRTTLESIYNALVTERPTSFEDCVQWARLKFETMFTNDIKQLLHNFPLDTRTNTGELFWSGPKRPPQVLEFSVDDPTHLNFVVAAANLRAFTYGISTGVPAEEIAKIASNVIVPEFVPKKVAIQTEENQKVEEDVTDSLTAEQLISMLPSPADVAIKMHEVEFEKDDDTNFHMDFITACSNLRARNYKIPEADKSKTKLIAGKIIPAMVTTTALVTGLVCFELLKVLQPGKKIECFKNAFLNLAIPFLTLSEPAPAATSQYGPEEKPVKWSLWDRFDVNLGRDVLLSEFIDYFKKEHGLEISMISAGTCIIYSFFQNKTIKQERLKKPVGQVIQEVSKQPFPDAQKYVNMEICAEYDGEDAEVPCVRYKFRH